MRCPYCNAEGRGKVVTHAANPPPGMKVRYRKCWSCKRNYRTREEIVETGWGRLTGRES